MYGITFVPTKQLSNLLTKILSKILSGEIRNNFQMSNTSVKIMGNKLSLFELSVLSKQLRGKRADLAARANVAKGTVDNTLSGKHQNLQVLKAAAEMLKEQKAAVGNSVILELREELSALE